MIHVVKGKCMRVCVQMLNRGGSLAGIHVLFTGAGCGEGEAYGVKKMNQVVIRGNVG